MVVSFSARVLLNAPRSHLVVARAMMRAVFALPGRDQPFESVISRTQCGRRWKWHVALKQMPNPPRPKTLAALNTRDPRRC